MALPSGVIMMWDSTAASIPSGWSRVTGMDGNRFPKGHAATTGSTGGSAAGHTHQLPSHTHTSGSHSHANGTTGTAGTGSQVTVGGATTEDAGSHTHPQSYASYSETIGSSSAVASGSTTANLPSYKDVIFIQSNGTTNVSTSVICWFNSATPPANYTEVDNGIWYRSAAVAGNGGGTGGGSTSHNHAGNTNAHTHAVSSHTHTVTYGATSSTTASVDNTAGSNNAMVGGHAHASGGTINTNTDTYTVPSTSTSSDSMDPLNRTLNAIKANSEQPAALGTIAIWLNANGSIPATWALCDGSGGTVDMIDRYVKNDTTTVGTAGGASSHTHTYSHSHSALTGHTHTGSGSTIGSPTGSTNTYGTSISSGQYISNEFHNTHAPGTSGSANSVSTGSTDPSPESYVNDPPYYTVLFIQKMSDQVASSEDVKPKTTDSPAILGAYDIQASEQAKPKVTDANALGITEYKGPSTEDVKPMVSGVPTVDAAVTSPGENAKPKVTEQPSVANPIGPTAENAKPKVTESVSVRWIGDFPPNRLRADVYSVSGAVLGPLTSILSADYSQELDTMGMFTLSVPADDPQASVLASGVEVRVYREGEGHVFTGIVEQLDTAVEVDGSTILTISGLSLAAKLIYDNSGLGRSLPNMTLRQAVDGVLFHPERNTQVEDSLDLSTANWAGYETKPTVTAVADPYGATKAWRLASADAGGAGGNKSGIKQLGVLAAGTWTLEFWGRATSTTLRVIYGFEDGKGDWDAVLTTTWQRFVRTLTTTGSTTYTFQVYEDTAANEAWEIYRPIVYAGQPRFAPGAIDTVTNNLYARFDGVSDWESLVGLANLTNTHVREDPVLGYVDVGAFGDDSGLVFRNVAQVLPELAGNLRLYPITSLKVAEASTDLVNSIIPVGAGEGVNQLTLQRSTRDPGGLYSISTFVDVSGQTTYYLEDAASVATYGRRRRVQAFNDVAPIAAGEANYINAANALYDVAATHLSRHKDPLVSYEVGIVGLKTRNVSGTPLIKLGQKVRLQYQGVVEDTTGRRSWRNVNGLFWVMSWKRTFNSSGQDTWSIRVATVDRQPEDLAAKISSAMQNIQAVSVGMRPYTYREIHGPYRQSVEYGKPATFYAEFDDNVQLMHKAVLTVAIKAVRSNSSAAASGGGHTSSGGSSHTHTVSGSSTDGGGAGSSNSVEDQHIHNLGGSGAMATPNADQGTLIEGFAFTGFVTSGTPSVASTQDNSNAGDPHSHSLNNHTHAVDSGNAVSILVAEWLHTHDLSGATSGAGTSHTHTVQTSHSHGISGVANGTEASHTHAVQNHTHPLTYGVYVGPSPSAPQINLTLNGVDVTGPKGGPWDSEFSIDITAELSDGNGQPKRQRNSIQLSSSELVDVEVTVKSLVSASSVIPI